MNKLFIILFCIIATCNQIVHSNPPPVIPPNATWEDVCLLPKEIGMCRAAEFKFYYNKDTQQCAEFTYGGCDGNYNNFQTLNECRAFCEIPAQQKAAAMDPNINSKSFPLEENNMNNDTSNNNDINNNDNNGTSGGRRNKWNLPIFGGIFAGLYSLGRDLFYW